MYRPPKGRSENSPHPMPKAFKLAAAGQTVADLPNVLELLPKPRASLPPVDFQLLSSPVSFAQRVHTPHGAASRSERPLTAPVHGDGIANDDTARMQPQASRCALRTRRRAGALGNAAHALNVHELCQRSPRWHQSPVTPVVAMRRFRALAGTEGGRQSSLRLANNSLAGIFMDRPTTSASRSRSGAGSRPASRGEVPRAASGMHGRHATTVRSPPIHMRKEEDTAGVAVDEAEAQAEGEDGSADTCDSDGSSDEDDDDDDEAEAEDGEDEDDEHVGRVGGGGLIAHARGRAAPDARDSMRARLTARPRRTQMPQTKPAATGNTSRAPMEQRPADGGTPSDTRDLFRAPPSSPRVLLHWSYVDNGQSVSDGAVTAAALRVDGCTDASHSTEAVATPARGGDTMADGGRREGHHEMDPQPPSAPPPQGGTAYPLSPRELRLTWRIAAEDIAATHGDP